MLGVCGKGMLDVWGDQRCGELWGRKFGEVHVSTDRSGNPFWNSGFLSHSHMVVVGRHLTFLLIVV